MTALTTANMAGQQLGHPDEIPTPGAEIPTPGAEIPIPGAAYPVQILSTRKRKAFQRGSAPQPQGPYLLVFPAAHQILCCRGLQQGPPQTSSGSQAQLADPPLPVPGQSLLVRISVCILSQFHPCSHAPCR